MIEDVTDNNSSPEDDGVTPDRYVNYQAFLARLMGVRLWPPNPNGVLIAMHGAFKKGDKNEILTVREAWIMGALQWILWSGPELFKLLPQATDTQQQEEDSFTRKSWQDWKSGFQNIAENDRYGKECRLLTTLTVEMMQSIERMID